MYLAHFGLSEAPYRITPHTDFFFDGANRGATLEALLYAITHDEGIVKVTGEVGSGKTMLCRVLIERLPAEVETVYLANPSLARDEIVLAILDDLKLPAAGQRANLLLRELQDHLIELYSAGKRVVLLIDEAHAMPAETLEEIRLLSNLESNRHKLLQIALFGQQELDEHLLTTRMRPLRERVTHSFRLEPLVHADVGQYLMFRLRQANYKGPDLFDRDAIKLIAQASEGLTRRINILADKALLSAYMEGEHGINRKHALAAINDSEFAPIGKRHVVVSLGTWWTRMGYWAAGLAAAVVLVAGGMFAGAKMNRADVESVKPAAALPVIPPTAAQSRALASAGTDSPARPAAPAVGVTPAIPTAVVPEVAAAAAVPRPPIGIPMPIPVPQFTASVAALPAERPATAIKTPAAVPRAEILRAGNPPLKAVSSRLAPSTFAMPTESGESTTDAARESALNPALKDQGH